MAHDHEPTSVLSDGTIRRLVEAQRIVENAIKDPFDHWLAGNPAQANKLLDFVVERADERLRRKQEKEISRKSAVRKLLTNELDKKPVVQVLVRGGKRTPMGGYERARAIYDALHCLDGVLLDDGGDDEVFVIGCTAQQSDPIPLGPDALERPEWSLNFQLTTHSPTTHRPA